MKLGTIDCEVCLYGRRKLHRDSAVRRWQTVKVTILFSARSKFTSVQSVASELHCLVVR